MTSEAGKILVVDDDADMRGLLSDVLESDGYRVGTAESGEKALQALAEEQYDLVLTDLRMKGMLGTALLSEIKHRYPDTGVILMTAFGTVETAIEAMKGGAMDYLIKPVKTEDVLRTAGRAAREVQLRREVTHLRREVYKEYSFHQILGKSRPMQEVFELIRRVADSPTNVLITGESGTGKELVARAVHSCSTRASEPFVSINCGAFPETLLESELFGYVKGAFTGASQNKRGLFEVASGGTIFLDEIGEMDLALQTKLLRVLQESTISRVGSNKEIKLDVRVIAATNKNLGQLVKENKFREDLFFRLQGFLIHLPPLRDRGDDVLLLARHFKNEFCKTNHLPDKSFSKDAIEKMLSYSWPGNVRELKATVERTAIAIDSNTITAEDFIFSSFQFS